MDREEIEKIVKEKKDKIKWDRFNISPFSKIGITTMIISALLGFLLSMIVKLAFI